MKPLFFQFTFGPIHVHKELSESSSKDGKTGWQKCHQAVASTMGDGLIEDAMLWLGHTLLTVTSVCGGSCIPATARAAAELSLYQLADPRQTLGLACIPFLLALS